MNAIEGGVSSIEDHREGRGLQNGKTAKPLKNQRSTDGDRQRQSRYQGPREWHARSPQGEIRCYGCKKLGHVWTRCPESSRGERERAVCLVAAQTQGSKRSSPGEHLGLDGPSENGPPCSLPIILGTIAESADGPEMEIRILRDTGAEQSLLHVGRFPLPPQPTGGPSVLLSTFGGDIGPFPLREIFLRSELATGLVTVAMIDTLPRKLADLGVALVLGNDLAGMELSRAPIPLPEPQQVVDTDKLAREFPEVFTACVVTRAQAKTGVLTPRNQESEALEGLANTFMAHLATCDPSLDRAALVDAQAADLDLAPLFSQLEDPGGEEGLGGCFLRQGVLMRSWRPPKEPAEEWAVCHQVVLPREYREGVLKMGHAGPVAGHVGVARTMQRIQRHFWWPGLRGDVSRYCRSCKPCQLAGKAQHMPPPAPLQPLPVIAEPFTRVMVDCVGPLPKTKKGNEYLLTILDMASRFPEAIPLRNIRAPTIIDALTVFFTRYGLPQEVQSDRGSNFTSSLFQAVLHELGITQVTSSAYHPESQGAIERFHRSLKDMVRAYSVQFPTEWDVAMPFLMFAARDSVSESTGFTPFQLIYGHEVRGPLQLLKERLTREIAQHEPLEYVARFTDRLQAACEIARERQVRAKGRMKSQYDKKAAPRLFKPGERVLVLLPGGGDKLGVRFEGPYAVVRASGPCNYVVATPDRRAKTRLCHVNLLKRYEGPEAVPLVGFVAATQGEEEGDGYVPREPVPVHLQNTQALQELRGNLSHLSPAQVEDVVGLVQSHLGLFRDAPGLTNVTVHDLDTGSSAPIKQHPYRLSPPKCHLVQQEVDYMLSIGVIEQAVSAWSSPVVLVGKEGGAHRLCIDYRKVNAITRSDAYPIPRIEDCIDRIGRARYVSKFDLLKGYWQVPMTDHAKEVSAFVTPSAQYVCRVLPFGMKNAPACFQRLMNHVTQGLCNVVTYIDDVVVYSDSWEEHLEHVGSFFSRLSEAGLVANLPKCEFGQGQVTYLGHCVGRGKVLPRATKVCAIANFPVPETRRQLMRVLGMAGFYRKFVPNFATVTAPLTELLRKGVKWRWSAECQAALEAVKAILVSKPVLVAPDFARPFCLAVDASEVGVGGVLLQAGDDNLERPVAYFSKKLNPHQKKYSTIEKEALALVLAVHHFEVYISGVAGDVVVYSDHNPLSFLARFQQSNARVFRWSLSLQPYSLSIRHVSGKDNVIADALSRGPI